MGKPRENAAPRRTTVRIPTASGDELEAWFYPADGDGPHPAVVMAHGLAGIKAGGLAPFAERFSSEGFTTIAFDYRQWGGSTGQPRDQTSVPRQREDYRTVVAWAIAHPEIDATRVFVWGTSFSGMHAVELAATDPRLRGAIAQSPLVDGLAGAAAVPLSQSLRLLAVGLADRLGSMTGRAPIYVAGSAAPGELGMVVGAEAAAGVDLIRPHDGTEWHNRVAARSALGIAAHRPVRKAGRIRCPILMVVAEHDPITPVGPALRVVDRAPKGELYRSRGGHYGPYEGGEDHDNVLAAEVEFLHRIVGKP
jgi:pimeloyl-ACP methyl ester carboxylesterase